MKNQVAFPFLVLPDAAPEWSGWLLKHNDESISNPGEYLPDWDRASSLVVEFGFNLDCDTAATLLDLDPATMALNLVVRVGTGPNRAWPRRILHTGMHPISRTGGAIGQEITLESSVLCGNLFLDAAVVLAGEHRAISRLAPCKAGSRLWETRTRIRLEGSEQRFPIEIQDFQAAGYKGLLARAPWVLNVSTSSWDRDFLGSVRLLINSAREDVVDSVKHENPILLQSIMGDVLVQICMAYLAETGPDTTNMGSPPGSIGDAAASWLREAWPGVSMVDIRSTMESAPGKFRATLLALAEI